GSGLSFAPRASRLPPSDTHNTLILGCGRVFTLGRLAPRPPGGPPSADRGLRPGTWVRVVPLERIPRPRFEVVRRVAGVGTAPPLSAIIIAGTAAALFLPLFFVPALPVRYGLLGWGTAYAAAAAALVLVTAAAVRGIAGTFARRPVSRMRWLVQMAITVAAGLAVGTAASRL